LRLFGRRKPLHRALAEAGGLELEPAPPPQAPAPPEVPSWQGEQRGEPGIHGVPRARRWDAVTTVEAPTARGDAVHFVALPDGTLVVEEDEPDDAMSALADAVAVAQPYRAEAVRRDERTWAVAASRIELVSLPELRGDSAELVGAGGIRTLHVDGNRSFGSVPALERVGEAVGGDYVVRAERVDGDVWQVEATPL
jgi:hypothetical protein